MSIRIITDSASDIPQGLREDLTVLPMHVYFGQEEFLDGVNLSHKQFYERLIEEEELPKTSQISPFEFEHVYEEAVAAGEQVIVITISSKLSGTYQSACIAAADYEGRVYVVDSLNATLGERCLVDYALRLKEQGKTAEQIVAELERGKTRIRLLALLDTLEYLKKGGRISKSVAMVGGMLSIKPVIAVVDGEVAMVGKARGSRNGSNLLVQEIEKAGGVDFSMPYYLGYTGLDDHLLRKYIEDSRALWEGHAEQLESTSVGGTIGTHVGPGAIAVFFFAAGE
ncbi:MAG: DegV family protein [Lachnospiraceae bacterium]|nr:DegV family protein [Lachnospiraceae bacterium]